MNNKELGMYRKNFYTNVENFIGEHQRLTIEDLYFLIAKTIKEVKKNNETSKKILIYIGNYVVRKEGKEEREILTYDGNLNAKYKLYKDIETGQVYRVSIKNVKDFEKNHKIIFPKIDINNVQEYNRKYEEMKFEYFKNLIYNDQKSSYKLIKKINEEK